MRTTLLVWALLSAAPALAEFKAALTASAQRVGTDDLVELTVLITDPPLGTTIRWPDSPDFHALQRTSTSSSKGKGGTVQSMSETRTFRPLRAGVLEFPKATVQSALGTTLTTSPVELTVLQGHVTGALRSGKPPKPPPIVPPPDAKEVFLHAALLPGGPSLGDVVQVRLSLFSRSDVRVAEINEVRLELDGFEFVELPVEPLPVERTLDGVAYREFQLRSCRLVTLQTGTFQVKATALVVREDSGGGAVELSARVPPLVVLPADDARTSWSKTEAAAVLARSRDPLERLSRQGAFRVP